MPTKRLAVNVCTALSIFEISDAHIPAEIFVGPISASGRSGAGGKEACACSARAVPNVVRKAMPSAKGVRWTRIVIPIPVQFRISRRFPSASADVAQGRAWRWEFQPALVWRLTSEKGNKSDGRHCGV
jgi:hypothetical protein